jgi:hypothetical protein
MSQESGLTAEHASRQEFEMSFEHCLSELDETGNPNDLAASALATRVSESDRGRTQFDVLDPGNWADRHAHSHRKGWKRTS